MLLFRFRRRFAKLTEYVCIAPNEAKRTETNRGSLHANDLPGRRTTIKTRMRTEMAMSVSPTPYLRVRSEWTRISPDEPDRDAKTRLTKKPVSGD